MLAPPAIFLAFVLVAAVGMFREDPDALPSTLIGQMVPPVAADPVGTLPSFTQTDLVGGGLKLVNFWASWCAPCRAEHATLMALSTELPIYGVNKDDRDDQALAFLDELGNPFIAVTNDDTRQSIEWGVYGLPETFLVDAEGRILHRVVGPLTERVLQETLQPVIDGATN